MNKRPQAADKAQCLYMHTHVILYSAVYVCVCMYI